MADRPRPPSRSNGARGCGVIAAGPLDRVDAGVVRWLEHLHGENGPVRVCPAAVVGASASPLAHLRESLRSLRVVEGVLVDRADAPPGVPCAPLARRLAPPPGPWRPPARLPDEAALRALAALPRPRVLVTGCFDLIHTGHLRLLRRAAGLGRTLIVGALSSAGIRAQPKNRGRRRPLWSERDRITVLEALAVNPHVLLFDGPDSLELVEALRPDVYAKEEADRARAIVRREAAAVERMGGRVHWLRARIPGLSSSGLADAGSSARDEAGAPSEARPALDLSGGDGRSTIEP